MSGRNPSEIFPGTGRARIVTARKKQIGTGTRKRAGVLAGGTGASREPRSLVRELKPSKRAAGASAGTHSNRLIAVQFLPELIFFGKVKKQAINRLKVVKGSGVEKNIPVQGQPVEKQAGFLFRPLRGTYFGNHFKKSTELNV